MTKEPDKSNWEMNYNNKSISGIEVRDKNGKLINFITIKHDEVLENKTPHRITIKLNENSEPLLPPPQTFEEIIQAKRRQQQLLYNHASSSASNATLSNRTARRVATAARQTVSAAVALGRRGISGTNSRTLPRSNLRGSSNRGRSNRRSKKKVKPTLSSIETPLQTHNTITQQQQQQQQQFPVNIQPKVPPITISTNHSKNRTPEVIHHRSNSFEPTPSTSTASVGVGLVTSMKDLNKNNPLLHSVDPKEVKLLLKSAPPGASVVLPNGTVIKKSRRGGARAGAGRKRSRPLPGQDLVQQQKNPSKPLMFSGEPSIPLRFN